MSDAAQHIRSALPEVYPRLWRYAMVKTRARDRADDLTQATVLRAMEKAHQFQVGTRLDAWLFTIMGSIWKNQLRADATRRGTGLQPVEDTPLASDAPPVEVNILAGEVLSQMAALPEAQRETLHLVYVEGLYYKEAAAALDIPIGTVMSRLANGRRALNETLGDAAPAPGKAKR